jgi:outer membrane lipoprotein-sorting protein
MKLFSIYILLLFSYCAYGQDAQSLLNKVVNKMEGVADYSANVQIIADIPLIKILPSNAKIYYKKPDKFKVVSKGIALLPKQGFTDMNAFLSSRDKYMVVFAGTKNIEGVETSLLTVIANDSDSEIILIKLWVDPLKVLIMASEITTRSSGNVKVDYKYNLQAKNGLPSNIKFTVDVKEFKMPKSFSSNPHKTSKSKGNKRKTGTIKLNISNYKVNQGIANSFFVK